MPARKPSVTLLKSLTETDKRVLEGIYCHRCLNEDLLYRFFYKTDDRIREYTAKRLRWMINKNLIEAVDYGADFPALFLTTLGIETYRSIFDLPREVLDRETGKYKPALFQASELKMRTNNLRHQMALNEFELQFEERANGEFAYQYQDEKFLDIYTVVRPDGRIRLNNVDLYLEMDMATEKKDSLLSKWNHYREYLKSKEYRYRDTKIIMLFIVNNIKLVESRRQTILSTLQLGLLDTLDNCFDIYVDSPEHLLDIIFDRLAPCNNTFQTKMASLIDIVQQYHQFVVSPSNFMNNITENDAFGAYIRKISPNRKILRQDGRLQEFLLDVYWDRPLSVLHKISYYGRITTQMQSSLHRIIPYLVVVPDEKQFYWELQVAKIVNPENIYFTTKDRLKGTSFPEALFQYDELGNLFHFTDFALQSRVFECVVKK